MSYSDHPVRRTFLRLKTIRRNYHKAEYLSTFKRVSREGNVSFEDNKVNTKLVGDCFMVKNENSVYLLGGAPQCGTDGGRDEKIVGRNK